MKVFGGADPEVVGIQMYSCTFRRTISQHALSACLISTDLIGGAYAEVVDIQAALHEVQVTLLSGHQQYIVLHKKVHRQHEWVIQQHPAAQ